MVNDYSGLISITVTCNNVSFTTYNILIELNKVNVTHYIHTHMQ